MTQITHLNGMPGGIKVLLNDLIGLAEFLKSYETVESFDRARRESEQLLATQQQILAEAKQNHDLHVNASKVRADIEVAKIDAETAELRARYDELNVHYEARVVAKAQLDSDLAQGQAKLDSIKAELARIAGSLG